MGKSASAIDNDAPCNISTTFRSESGTIARTTLVVATVRQHNARAECESPLREAFNKRDKGMAATRMRV